MKNCKIYLIIVAALFFSKCSNDDQVTLPILTTIPLLGQSTLPEGIAIDKRNDAIYVSGYGDGGIQKIVNGEATYFVSPYTEGFKVPVGMTIDEARNRLWVCHVSSGDVFSGGIEGAVWVFDLNTAQVLKKFEIQNQNASHFINDVILDQEGNAYITDSFEPTIWKVDKELTSLERFISSPQFVITPNSFNLNGITFTPDNRYLITAVTNPGGGDGALFRINVNSKEVAKVAIPAGQYPGGGDGIVFENASQMYSINFTTGITSIQFNGNDYLNATAAIITERNPQVKAALNAPTTAKINDGALFLVNSQFDKLFPGFPKYGQPFEVPFTITSVALPLLK
jgi:DNA-binding beta-propeller fold protein YncE